MKAMRILLGWGMIVALLLVFFVAACKDFDKPDTDYALASSAAWTASGEAKENRFGYAVRTAGDVNGDGYDDVIVGADRYKEFTGRAYVYPGGPSGLSASPVLTATGETVNNHFGYAVGAAGDVNGDGFDDVVIGAYHHGNFRGRVYVYAGRASGLRDIPLSVVSGEGPDGYFGRSVGTAGDVNGDGYDDVIVGAQAYDRSTGRVYVYAGGPEGLSADPIFVATGEGPADSFGQSVGAAGDVNGDGYDDIIIGAHGYESGMGRAYIYVGAPGGLDPNLFPTTTGEGVGDHFGYAVGPAGDVNGDGYDDVIIGAYGFNDDTGRAYVYAGGAEGLGITPIFMATGDTPGLWFGRSVWAAGDVNGDGYDDVIVGAQNYEDNTGRIHLYGGGSGGLGTEPLLVATGEVPNSWFGQAVGTAGDVNGDGYVDVIVGAYGFGEWTGRAYVYLGSGGGGR
jgi:hypothetical protein